MARMFLFLAFAALILMLAGVSGCASMNAEKNAPLIGERIDLDGVAVHVVTAGPRDSVKPPVVLIHGASVNLRDMKIALGDELSKDRFVIMVDRPGRGYSDRPDDGGYQLERQAALIKGAVDALGVKRPVVVGQSFGGSVALRYALEYQDEMSGLVVLAPVSHEWPGGVVWYNRAATMPVLGFFFRRLIIPAYGSVAAEGIVEASFAPNVMPVNYYEQAGVSLLFRAGDFKANATDIVHLKDEIRSQQHRYAELRLPVFIATGEADDAVSPDIHAKTLINEIDGAALTLFPETGHALHHAQSDAIIQLIDAIPLDGAPTE